MGIVPFALISYDGMAVQRGKSVEQKKVSPSSRKLVSTRDSERRSKIRIQNKNRKKSGVVPVKVRRRSETGLFKVLVSNQGTEMGEMMQPTTRQTEKKRVLSTRARLRNRWMNTVVKQGRHNKNMEK
ncbi:MAG: hypothetical protein LBH08_02220 [Puniceicoccales bacterium]|nr:hypothetical protein [Puniceicoccales bacterium]